MVFNELYLIFDPIFIYHSYSSRLGKGTHLAVNNLAKTLRKVSQNYSTNAFVLKCDVKKFFASVPHQKLLELIKRKVSDPNLLRLIEKIIDGFVVDNFPKRERKDKIIKRGLPIGNVTSQIFANIYLNELDRFIKHRLRVKYYFRYADDFAIISDNPDYLRKMLIQVELFLNQELLLKLHKDKVVIRKFRQGIDFLGYIVLPYYSILRVKTKRRILKKLSFEYTRLQNKEITADKFKQILQSYVGILKHCRAYELARIINDNCR